MIVITDVSFNHITIKDILNYLCVWRRVEVVYWCVEVV